MSKRSKSAFTTFRLAYTWTMSFIACCVITLLRCSSSPYQATINISHSLFRNHRYQTGWRECCFHACPMPMLAGAQENSQCVTKSLKIGWQYDNTNKKMTLFKSYVCMYACTELAVRVMLSSKSLSICNRSHARRAHHHHRGRAPDWSVAVSTSCFHRPRSWATTELIAVK